MTENTFKSMTQAFAKPTAVKSGSLIGSLTQEEQREVEAFGEWLKATTDMTQASVASYRSYLAGALKAFKEGKSRDDLTSSQRSAVNKYGVYLSSKS